MHIHARSIYRLALLAALAMPNFALADTIIFLTRHAEKSTQGSDPQLTPDGRMRANNLAALLHKAGIEHIFSTDVVRTKDTAQPLATLLKLPIQIYDAKQQAPFAEKLKTMNATILVVGHSNTLTDLVRLLGGKPGADMPETEYDRLYQLIVDHDGKVTTVMLTSWAKPPMAVQK